jgi:ribonucleotide reductase alpha subunit
MRLPFECPAAMQLNKDIFETMYFASLEASCEIAEKEGAYSTYEGNTIHTFMYIIYIHIYIYI